MSVNNFQDFFRRTIYCLDSNKIDYVIVGGATMPYYGNIRTTQDVDIMIETKELHDDQLKHFVECLNKNKISITYDELQHSFSENIHVNGVDEKTWVFRLDIEKNYFPMDFNTYIDCREISLFGVKAKITSPERLISVKISTGFRSNTD